MYSFPRATVIRHLKLGSLEQQKCILLQFHSQKSDMKVSAGHSTKDCRREAAPCLFQLLVVSGVLGL